jgi:hypothetical protein
MLKTRYSAWLHHGFCRCAWIFVTPLPCRHLTCHAVTARAVPSHHLPCRHITCCPVTSLKAAANGGPIKAAVCVDLSSAAAVQLVDWKLTRSRSREQAKVALSATHGADHSMVRML